MLEQRKAGCSDSRTRRGDGQGGKWGEFVRKQGGEGGDEPLGVSLNSAPLEGAVGEVDTMVAAYCVAS